MNYLGYNAKVSIMIKTRMKSISVVAMYLRLCSVITYLKLEEGDSEVQSPFML